jgi:hypothetical protein
MRSLDRGDVMDGVSPSTRGLHIFFNVNEVPEFPVGRWTSKTKEGVYGFEV